MQKRWRPIDRFEIEPVRLRELEASTEQRLLSHAIEFASLGFEHVGDYRLHMDSHARAGRYYCSAEGAVLTWVNEEPGGHAIAMASILNDGTLLRSIPRRPVAPWSCWRFPVHVQFCPGADLDELVVRHQARLAELESGCGSVIEYAAQQVPDVIRYMHMLMHETRHGKGAPSEVLLVPRSKPHHELVIT